MKTLIFGRGRRSTPNLLTWEGAMLRLQGAHPVCMVTVSGKMPLCSLPELLTLHFSRIVNQSLLMWDVVPSANALVLLTSQENIYRMLLALHYDWVLMQYVLVLVIAEDR